MTYTNKGNIEDYLKRSLTNPEKTHLDLVLLEAVDEFINNYTGRSFEVDTTATSRYYDGEGSICPIDDCSEITSVELVIKGATESLAQTLTADDYVAYPLNTSYKNYLIKALGEWPELGGSVKVTAKWGREKPNQIIQAATMLASSAISSDKNLKSESIEGYSRVFSEIADDNEDIKKILDQYTGVTI